MSLIESLESRVLFAGGAPDPSFGTNGTLAIPFNSVSANANALAVQPDSRILVAGQVGSGFGLVRLNSNGTFDTSFGTNGSVTDSNLLSGTRFNALAVQPNGQILAAGTEGAGRLTVVRFNSSGSLDTGFADAGQFTLASPTGQANALAVDPSGNILVAGQLNNSSTGTPTFSLLRLTSSGILDTSFGTNGIATNAFSTSSNSTANGLVVQPNGQILVIGTANAFGQPNIALARFTPSGALDTSFGNFGVTTQNFSTFNTANNTFTQPNSGNGIALLPGGDFLIAGQVNDRFALTRFTPSGTLDTTFGVNGLAINSSLPAPSSARRVLVEGDGSILGVGTLNNNGFALARFTSSGNPDISFGLDSTGIIVNTIGLSSQPADAAFDTQNNLLLAAGQTTLSGSPFSNFALSRFNLTPQPSGIPSTFAADAFIAPSPSTTFDPFIGNTPFVTPFPFVPPTTSDFITTPSSSTFSTQPITVGPGLTNPFFFSDVPNRNFVASNPSGQVSSVMFF